MALSSAVSLEAAVLGERTAFRTANQRRTTGSPTTIPTMATDSSRNTRSILTLESFEGRGVENFIKSTPARFASPSAQLEATEALENGIAECNDHTIRIQKKAWAEIQYTLMSAVRRATSVPAFPYILSSNLRAQAIAAATWMNKVSEALPIDTFLTWPFANYIPPNSPQTPAEYLWKMLFEGVAQNASLQAVLARLE